MSAFKRSIRPTARYPASETAKSRKFFCRLGRCPGSHFAEQFRRVARWQEITREWHSNRRHCPITGLITGYG